MSSYTHTLTDVSFFDDYHNPYQYSVDIFDLVLSNFSDIARTLTVAPYIYGQERGSPAYEFRGKFN